MRTRLWADSFSSSSILVACFGSSVSGLVVPAAQILMVSRAELVKKDKRYEEKEKKDQ